MNAFNTLPTLEVINPGAAPIKGTNLVLGALVPVVKETKKFWFISEAVGSFACERKVSKVDGMEVGRKAPNAITFALVATQKAQETVEPTQAPQAPQAPQNPPANVLKAILDHSVVFNQKELDGALGTSQGYVGILENLAESLLESEASAAAERAKNAKLHAVHAEGQEFDSDNEALGFLNDKVSEIQATLDDLRGTVENYNKENEEGRNTIADLQEWLKEAQRAEALGFEAPPMWKLFDLIEALPDLATIEE